MKSIANGESARLMRGRVYEFRCKQGTVMQGSPIVYCDGRAWNGTKPECLSKLIGNIHLLYRNYIDQRLI